MIPAPRPPDEDLRLDALRRLEILDSAPEESFDRITRLAQRTFNVPMVLVSLVDENREWFKSRHGVGQQHLPRDESFCAHAILRPDVMVVPDALIDPRFDDNPNVSSGSGIRFYAGAPLYSPDGQPIGTLCVIDRQPREWSEEDSAALTDFARLVDHEIVRRYDQGQHRALLALTAVTSLDTTGSDERLRQALQLGTNHLGMSRGVISAIDGDRYEILVQVGPPGSMVDGQVLSLQETYCAMTVEGRDVLAIAHMQESPRSGHPSYRTMRLESYIGIRLTVEGRLFGTLHFADDDPHRSPAFPPGEVDFVRLLGRWLESALSRRRQAERLGQQQLLLSAISTAQSTFIENSDRKQAFDDLLTDVLALTDCEYGFIGEVLHDDEGAPYLKTRALTNIAWNDATARLYAEQNEAGLEFRNLDTLFGRTLSTGAPVIANDPYGDPRRGGLPYEHPPMNSYLGLPLNIGDRFVGMLGLANHPNGFDDSWIETLLPLTTTIAQLIEASRTQEQLRSEQIEIARLSQVASQMTSGVVITDLDGCIEWVNEEFTRLFGYRKEELLGARPHEILRQPWTNTSTDQAIESAVSRLSSVQVELDVADRSGRRFWVSMQSTPLKDEAGHQRGFLVIVTDVSDRKRVERMKDEFVSTVSHELRTPLTSITGSLGLVAGGVAGPLPERAMELVTIAQKNSQRLTELINDLLDLEKLIEGGLPILPEPHALMPLLERALVDNTGYADQYGIEFAIGERADDAMVDVDSLRLMQILSNLLSNAAKFSAPGGRVTVNATVVGDDVRVDVVDRGVGISDDFRDRVFEKFSQADSSDTRARGGSGLGLAITRVLVERMGGTIGFDSVEGAGSTFHFTLPLLPAP